MTETFCTSGAVKLMAGSGAKVLLATEYTELIEQAESEINVATRYNWTDVYTAGLNTDVKKILERGAAVLAANDAVKWDMSGYTSRIEAEDIINVNRDSYLRTLSILRDVKARDFVNGA